MYREVEGKKNNNSLKVIDAQLRPTHSQQFLVLNIEVFQIKFS